MCVGGRLLKVNKIAVDNNKHGFNFYCKNALGSFFSKQTCSVVWSDTT